MFILKQVVERSIHPKRTTHETHVQLATHFFSSLETIGHNVFQVMVHLLVHFQPRDLEVLCCVDIVSAHSTICVVYEHIRMFM